MEFKTIDKIYRPLIEHIVRESNGIKYYDMFLEPDFSELNADKAVEILQQLQSVYVRGIIERSHMACVTTLARTSRWLSSITHSVEDGNALSFASSLRGLLESSADSFHLMKHLHPSLASSFKYIYIALNYPKDLKNGLLNFESLENLLIHYAYAKHWKRGEQPPLHHQNKSNTEYIKCLESFDVPGLSDLYSELCQLTHPASPSVFCFIDETDNDLTFNPNRDSLVINDILDRYKSSILGMIQYPLNSVLMALALIHRLVPEWPAMSDEVMSKIGNSAQTLSDFDKFYNEYKPGTGLSYAELRLASNR
ncbi:hypothetical protein [Shewanella baltica]|uniref:hypothetical protein n=1 Tax=Shewanella baltica TaxID=62322 RepID=UPI0039AEB650